ncbi:LysR family transcriptional regulator [Mesorhizobium sp. CA8]|uniref:LysR family transcriptional regulator n=1 Tax=Mesorhizobium sp. CA8 TaxID=2876637 RepID=UPI001CCB5953|nr:LysR family transcriptional regulator [Mesorhizobium sp. CA8]
MNLNALDLNLVRVLDALLREKSVTRAGEQIGLSQPAVSAALNRLRHALNDQLFVRRGNDMVPTPRAESLAEPVRAALREIERAFQPATDFDPARLERTFTFMGADFFSMLLMPPFAARIAAVAPGVSFRFLDSAIGDVSKLLQEDRIDLAWSARWRSRSGYRAWRCSARPSPSSRRKTMPLSAGRASPRAKRCR